MMKGTGYRRGAATVRKISARCKTNSRCWGAAEIHGGSADSAVDVTVLCWTMTAYRKIMPTLELGLLDRLR